MLIKFDNFDLVCFFNGLIFYAPVALLIRTRAGVSSATFFMLQALLSIAIFLGEVPTGFITDKIGYRKSIIISQTIMFMARVLMMMAYLTKSIWLFILEALVEGIGDCFSSGTNEAYLYSVYGEENFMTKSAHSSNYGTTGFIISTVSYALIYRGYNIDGLLVATVVSGFVALVFSVFLSKEKFIDVSPERVSVKNVLSIFKNKESRLFLVMLSTFSLAWILINFFYVEKLENIGISEEWMSAIILVYSAIQMFAEPILSWIKKFSSQIVFVIVSFIAGGAIIIYGLVNHIWFSIILMCIVPLLISLPEYFLMEKENQLIDELGMEKNRAATLSIFNMGVNIIEIIALFMSSMFSLNAVRWCFIMVGIVLIFSAVLFGRNQKVR